MHLISGFRPCHSTRDVLLYVIDSRRKAIDAHKFVMAGFLDLEKAFDCVDHTILLCKLAYYVLVNGAHAWFKSYLSNRRQCVKYDGSLSSWGSIGVGVPQGSILGPLLFSLFVNYLSNVVDHTCVNMHADDIELHCSGDDLQLVQDDVHFEQGCTFYS